MLFAQGMDENSFYSVNANEFVMLSLLGDREVESKREEGGVGVFE